MQTSANVSCEGSEYDAHMQLYIYIYVYTDVFKCASVWVCVCVLAAAKSAVTCVEIWHVLQCSSASIIKPKMYRSHCK